MHKKLKVVVGRIFYMYGQNGQGIVYYWQGNTIMEGDRVGPNKKGKDSVQPPIANKTAEGRGFGKDSVILSPNWRYEISVILSDFGMSHLEMSLKCVNG
ncbi:hypothetical protein Leryth_009521 [Lithospermum erythrorhizon]|nr:hypothetical protein Leryth_009521 [Lithospermum erythrorhizon]